jgi:hypothetical protein
MGRTLAFLATNRASGRTLIWRRGPSARTTRIDHKVGRLHRRFCSPLRPKLITRFQCRPPREKQLPSRDSVALWGLFDMGGHDL